jgi:arsenate reductase
MTNKKARELLTTNGLLVKRPLLINEKNTLVGFKQEEWDSFFI